MKQNVPIIIPDKVWQQIHHLLREIPKQEWSGILFYRTEGSFGKSDFKCILEFIYLMDIGDVTFTKYDYDENVAKLMMNRPSLFDCKIGHIHSHHSMPVFFSSVDQKELMDNSAFHNFYLSVIVNNPGDVEAKIVFRASEVKGTSHKLSFRDEKGQWVENILTDEVIAKEIYCFHECNILGPDRDLEPLFVQRLKSIQLNTPSYLGKEGAVFTHNNPKAVWDKSPLQKNLFPDYDPEPVAYHYTVEEFISTLILQDLNPKIPVIKALEAVKDTSDIEMLGNSIVSTAVAHYEHCFPNDPQLLAFTATMNECVEILEEISPLILMAEVLMPYFDLELVN